jgi:hypothetical protein
MNSQRKSTSSKKRSRISPQMMKLNQQFQSLKVNNNEECNIKKMECVKQPTKSIINKNVQHGTITQTLENLKWPLHIAMKLNPKPIDEVELHNDMYKTGQYLSIDILEDRFSVVTDDLKIQQRYRTTRPVIKSLIGSNTAISKLIDEKRIVYYSGNTTIDKAQVIFLDDRCHGDMHQMNIRVQIANSITGSSRVLLAEGCGPDKITFNLEERDVLFGPNLIVYENDYYSGWDDLFTTAISLTTVRQRLHKDALEALGTECVKQLDYQFVQDSDFRTECLWNNINTIAANFPDSKILIFTGSYHSNDSWIHSNLLYSNFKFCIIGSQMDPDLEQRFKDTNMKLEYVRQYYLRTIQQ